MLPIIDIVTGYLSALPCVERVILFGSRARGDEESRSDIDLAIDCPNASDVQWQGINQLVQEARTLYKIDLVRLDRVEKSFQERILNEGKRLYER